MEFDMRLPTERRFSTDSVNIEALDWETIGRMVRERTREVVAMHFAAMEGLASRRARMTGQVEARGPADGMDRDER
jgi:hypothetical protein